MRIYLSLWFQKTFFKKRFKKHKQQSEKIIDLTTSKVEVQLSNGDHMDPIKTDHKLGCDVSKYRTKEKLISMI